MNAKAKLFPLFLMLEGKDVLVVGAGAVAEKKIAELAGARANVRVVAMAAVETVCQLAAAGAIALDQRRFRESDIDDAWLVIAATNDPATQKEVCDLAAERHIFAIAIDDPPNGSAYSASVLRRAPLTIAISSDGEAPALSRLLREIFEQIVPDGDWIDEARALREKWKAEGTPMASRFPELVRAFAERARRGT